MKVTIDRQFSITYNSYIFNGLNQIGCRIGFGDLRPPRESAVASKALKLRANDRNIAIYADDFPGADRELLRWSDAYFSVNLTPSELAASEKLRALGPVFSITAWGRFEAIRLIASTARRGGNLRHSYAQTRFQRIARRPIELYEASPPSAADYVFFASRRWSPKHPEADDPRHRFFGAMSGKDVEFEGGFTEKRMTLDDYICKSRRTALAFNSPAVHGCLGWKLGEYLALGKAILSTPLSKALPAPLRHGEHIHYVEDDEAAISAGIDLLLYDAEYRHHLERGARSWFERFLSPVAVVRRILNPI
jgi:hypothetical protein